MKILHIIASVLLLIGGINWGLYGLFDVDVVQTAFHSVPHLAKALYILIGIAAIFEIFACSYCRKSCSK